MSLFVDTSAIYAFLDDTEKDHPSVHAAWHRAAEDAEDLITTNYVLLETSALVQKRLGLPPVERLHRELFPLLRIEWVNAEVHEAAASALLLANRRDLSLVDCISFVVMRRLGLSTALTLDVHFSQAGFACLPEPAGSPA